MKQLFIPELGTELKLAEDWTFNLYSESRNETLRNELKINQLSIWYAHRNIDLLSFEDLSQYENQFDEFVKSLQLDFPMASYHWSDKEKAAQAKKERDDYWKRLAENRNILKEEIEKSIDNKTVFVSKIPVILPKDSTLIIDRIYIRKGNQKFSSVSFYWKDKPLGKGFKKYVRFWCELKSANNIKFY